MSEELEEGFNYVEDHSTVVQDLIRKGEKIAAIKEIREQKGLGLKDAKEYVEYLAVTMAEKNENFGGIPQKAGCGALIAISVGIAAFAKIIIENFSA